MPTKQTRSTIYTVILNRYKFKVMNVYPRDTMRVEKKQIKTLILLYPLVYPFHSQSFLIYKKGHHKTCWILKNVVEKWNFSLQYETTALLDTTKETSRCALICCHLYAFVTLKEDRIVPVNPTPTKIFWKYQEKSWLTIEIKIHIGFCEHAMLPKKSQKARGIADWNHREYCIWISPSSLHCFPEAFYDVNKYDDIEYSSFKSQRSLPAVNAVRCPRELLCKPYLQHVCSLCQSHYTLPMEKLVWIYYCRNVCLWSTITWILPWQMIKTRKCSVILPILMHLFFHGITLNSSRARGT